MSKERNLRSIANAGLRLGAAALAVQMSMGTDRVARADINEPVRYPLADGRLLADAPLRTAGRVVDFTGPNGLNFCGVTTSEATVLTVISNEDSMNIKAAGNPDVFVDPTEGGGTDYPSRAASAVELLQSKATELINRTNRWWRRVAVILTRDAVNQNVCDLITDSGPFAPESPAPVQPTAVPAVPTAVPVGAPGAARIGGECNPIAVTSLGPRPDAVINGTRVRLEVRDLNSCVRPLFRHETGVGAGQNYKISLPDSRWSVIIASTTAEVQREGGMAQRFLNGPVIKIQGPFKGGVGLFEGAFEAVPEEWADFRIQQIMPIQRLQVGDPNRQPVLFQG